MEIISRRAAEKIMEGIAGRIEPGRGDKILWLHGYTLDSSSWGEMWSLLPGWHHIGIDLPGHGASEPIAEGSSLHDLGCRLGKLCMERDIRHIVALSFGTITAIQIAIEFPRFFSSIVLGAPAIAGGPQDTEMAKVYSELIIRYHRAGRTQELHTLWLSSRAWRGLEKRSDLVAALSSLVARHSWAELESYAKMQQFTTPRQNEHDLAGIQSSLLIMIGEHEMSAFRQCADILERLVPHCRQYELPNTDHLCMLQSPQLSASLIEAHLMENAVSTPGAGT